MSKFVITIKLDNAAFVDDPPEYEVDNILSKLSGEILDTGLGIHTLRDYNGNVVGRAELIEDNPPPGVCATQSRAK